MGKSARGLNNITPIVDVWGTEDNTYSPNTFYVRSKDSQGHSTVYHVRMPDYVAGKMAALIESKKIPSYRTAADFIRDAIIHRLHYIGENFGVLSDEIEKAILRVTMENQTLQYEEEIKSYRELCIRVREVCQEAWLAQDYTALYYYIQRQQDLIETIREPFKSEILEVFTEYQKRLEIMDLD